MTRKPPSRSPRDEHESGRADEQPIYMQLGIKPSRQAQAPLLLRARAVKGGCTK